MSPSEITMEPVGDVEAPAAAADRIDEPASSLVVDELLVEDVSIDGMCGVY